MKKRWWTVAMAGVLAAIGAWAQGSGAAEAGGEGDEEYVEIPEEVLRAEVGDRGAAEALMARVREGVPRVPLEMHAEVQVLNKYGKRVGTWEAEASLKPDRERGGRKLRYETGEGAVYEWQGEGEGPGLGESVGRADFTWEELGFGFFWWTNPRITGVEKLRHRWNCQVVELDGPKGETLRLWVAPSWGAVVQGELARGGTVEKRFEVESVTKVRKVYMLSEMTVRNAATGGRSRLKLGNLRMVAPDYTEEEWKAFEEPVRW
ncbi:MAG: hypothetical protein IK066_01085 [Kiritimatiellae bacterium]|nr:hypothetical protein [Kiritimatiellia bacterium]